MKRQTLLYVTLVTMCTIGLVAASAFALPDISVTLTSTFPLHLEYNSATVLTKLENANGGVLTGEGLKLLSLVTALGSPGTFHATFKKVEKAGVEKCFNTGVEANGEVATEGRSDIVYTSLAGSTQGLQIGVLLLLTPLTGAAEISCPTNANKMKVQGDIIASINLLAKGNTAQKQYSGMAGVLAGTTGKQTIRAFWNSAGTALLAKLESNIDGAGFKESNQVVEGEPEQTALEGKMFNVTGI